MMNDDDILIGVHALAGLLWFLHAIKTDEDTWFEPAMITGHIMFVLYHMLHLAARGAAC